MDITLTPWRRYGQDRLYLSTDGDEKLGWIDNKTRILTVVPEEDRTVIDARARAHVYTTNTTANALSPRTAVASTVLHMSASTPDAPAPVAELAPKTANSTTSIAAPVILTNTRGAAAVGRANWTDFANNVPGQGLVRTDPDLPPTLIPRRNLRIGVLPTSARRPLEGR